MCTKADGDESKMHLHTSSYITQIYVNRGGQYVLLKGDQGL